MESEMPEAGQSEHIEKGQPGGKDDGSAPAGAVREAEPAGPGLSERGKDRLFLAALFTLIACYFALFATLSILRYANFRAPGVDIAIFDQAVWLLSRFEGFTSTIRGMNIFGDHFAPILFMLVPLYWVGGNVPALLVVQTAALALGALPLYLIARDRLESRWVALAVAGAYLAYPALGHMNLFDFHPETIALCFLLFAVLALERRRFAWVYVLCLGALLCKEDMALAVFVLGLLVYFKYDRRAGKIIAAGTALYLLVVVLLVIPALGPEGFQYSGRLTQFGNTPLEAAKNFVLRPLRTLGIIATRQNLSYVFALLAPVAFLCLLSPVFLLPALPAFAINIVSDLPEQHTILFQYTAALIPFVFVALVFGLRKMRIWSDGAFRRQFVMGAVAFVLVASSLAGAFYLGPSPLAETWTLAKYRSDAHIDVIREGLSVIPQDARVSAQIYLLPHLSEREYIYMFPQPFIDLVDREYYESLPLVHRKYRWPVIYRRLEKGVDKSEYPVPVVDYVVLDRGADPWPLPREQHDVITGRLLESGKYQTVFDRDGVLVLKRKDAP